MKKFAVLTSVLALAACGGGSSHHGGDSSYQGSDIAMPVFNNASLTTMPVSVNNSEKINSYVAERLGENVDALQEFESLYNIATGKITNPSEEQLRHAFLMMNRNDFDSITNSGEDLEEALNTIKSGAYIIEKKLSEFFPITGDGGFKFTYEQSLSDIEFGTSSGYMKFNMEDGNIVSFTENPGEKGALTLKRTGDKTFELSEKRYMYEIDEDSMDSIYSNLSSVPNLWSVLDDFQYFASNEDLDPENLKQDLKKRLIALVNDEETKNKITNTINGIDYEKWSIDSGKVDLESMGNLAGLKYADFGYLSIGADFTENSKHIHEDSYDIYVGGYDTKTVNVPSTDMVFNGKAVATVHKEMSSPNPDKHMLAKTDHAKLELSGGVETLSMEFSKGEAGYQWYDITASKNINNYDLSSIDIAYNNEEINAKIPEDFRVNEDMVNKIKDVNEHDYGAFMETHYYGDNNVATEATGFIEIGMDNLEVTAAFGGTK